MPAKERIETIKRHFASANKPLCGETERRIPKRRQELLKWNGWGYKDSKFFVNDNKQISFSGQRYYIANKILPNFKEWAATTLGVDVTKYESRESNSDCEIPSPTLNENFVMNMKNLGMEFSLDPQDRLFRAHGHTMKEIFILRHGNFQRVPDIVVWPKCHDDVVNIVQSAYENDVVIIPFGGGTSVSGALECPAKEERMIVSLDTSLMNRILWVNKENNTILVEAGIIGQDLERELAKYGLCTGHEPDSHEFSSLGGWIATRASGMRKNIYGNIEDMLVHVKMVTPKGTVQRNCKVPRMSCGPDVHHIILGSEGTLGVITEAVIRVRPLPPFIKYGSIAFSSFEEGVSFLKEVVRQQLKPASLRLMDNEQFMFGLAIKPECSSAIRALIDKLKMYYVTQYKGFDLQKMCVATVLLEGTKEDVESLERQIYKIAHEFSGLPGGEENGKRGYMLTFVIAYIRDLGLDHGVVAESFETSVPWDRVLDLCRNVKDRLLRECIKHGITFPPLASCRVTQSYDVGACVYFYFAFNYEGISDPVHTYEDIEAAARDEIIASGGSISHHHGVGKLRKHWVTETVSETGAEMLKAVKERIDPKNIFANGNLIDV